MNKFAFLLFALISAWLASCTTCPFSGNDQQIEQDKSYMFIMNKSSNSASEKLATFLDAVAEYMKEHENLRVRIVGHSDNVSSLKINRQNSQNFAQIARDYLYNKGIAMNRILIRGVGSIYPIETNNTEAGRRKNNRIEITLGGEE